MNMTYGSVCSGIEAATVAWHALGWQCAFVSEIEPFPCATLKHHYPNVPNLGDMTKHRDWPNYAIDILVGGTPCQAFSIAGLRTGLADPRGNLTLTFLSIVEQYQPRWVVWENVPGVLSDESGAFGSFLGGLEGIGYGFAYRVLDAQYFGLAQRRKRVFVVGHSGGQWQRAAAVLFEPESLRWDSAPSRETKENPTTSTENSVGISVEPVANTLSKCNAGGGAGKVDGCSYVTSGSKPYKQR
jgi:DNA (cytosine-5)-methyltransferase 1